MRSPQSAAARPPSRVGLFAPYAALAVAAIGWTAYWCWAAAEVKASLASVGASSGLVSLSAAQTRLYGYPFRIDLDLRDARFRARGGLELTAPVLKAETYAYDRARWIAAAPEGLVLRSPAGGQVRWTAGALRGSARFGPGGPEIVAEGARSAFAASGDLRFPLTSAVRFVLRARPLGADREEILAQASDATLADAPDGRARDLAVHGTALKPGRLLAEPWPAAIAAWARTGGRIEDLSGGVHAGPAGVEILGGGLGLTPAGRLQGEVTLRVSGDGGLPKGRGLGGLAGEGQGARVLTLRGDSASPRLF